MNPPPDSYSHSFFPSFRFERVKSTVRRAHEDALADNHGRRIDAVAYREEPFHLARLDVQRIDLLAAAADDHQIVLHGRTTAYRLGTARVGVRPADFGLPPIDGKDLAPLRAEIDAVALDGRRDAGRRVDRHAGRRLSGGQVDDVQAPRRSRPRSNGLPPTSASSESDPGSCVSRPDCRPSTFRQ